MLCCIKPIPLCKSIIHVALYCVKGVAQIAHRRLDDQRLDVLQRYLRTSVAVLGLPDFAVLSVQMWLEKLTDRQSLESQIDLLDVPIAVKCGFGPVV